MSPAWAKHGTGIVPAAFRYKQGPETLSAPRACTSPGLDAFTLGGRKQTSIGGEVAYPGSTSEAPR